VTPESPTTGAGDDVGRWDRFVSTGSLPAPARVDTLVDDAHRRFAPVTEGACSDVYPALAAAEPDRFGICVVDVEGRVAEAGDVATAFTIMSVAKPFVFALVCEAIGVESARRRLGVNATGRPFNDPDTIDPALGGRTNPMVNPGALATTSLVPGDDADDRWQVTLDGLSRFAARPLAVDEGTYASASATNHVNRDLVDRLVRIGAIGGDADDVLDRYTRQSCIEVTAHDLAVMGATLADGGVNPVTGDQVATAATCRAVLAVMTTAGLYETSGDWLWDVGLPGKSGIGGGIVTVSPGKGGLGTFSPRLDDAGNSVRGQLASALLARRLGLDLFASEPTGR
jgi:glutaminase